MDPSTSSAIMIAPLVGTCRGVLFQITPPNNKKAKGLQKKRTSMGHQLPELPPPTCYSPTTLALDCGKPRQSLDVVLWWVGGGGAR